MPYRGLVTLAVLLATLVLAACGDGGATSARTVTSARTAVPALGARAARPGEVLVKGQSSPATSGPYDFDGTYTVRFEQIAPEDPNLDFKGQTPFTAALERRAGDTSGAVELFGVAARSGRRTLRVHGRYVIDVSFGDFPYALRLTPRG